MNDKLFGFVGGTAGDRQIVRMDTIVGDLLPAASRLAVIDGSVDAARPSVVWRLHGRKTAHPAAMTGAFVGGPLMAVVAGIVILIARSRRVS